MLERKLWNGDPVGQHKVLGCIEINGDERCMTYGAAIVMITAALCLFIVPFIVVQHHRRQIAQNIIKLSKEQQEKQEQEQQKSQRLVFQQIKSPVEPLANKQESCVALKL